MRATHWRAAAAILAATNLLSHSGCGGDADVGAPPPQAAGGAGPTSPVDFHDQAYADPAADPAAAGVVADDSGYADGGAPVADEYRDAPVADEYRGAAPPEGMADPAVVDSGGQPVASDSGYADRGYPPGYDASYGREGGYPPASDSGYPPASDSGYPPGYEGREGRPPIDDGSVAAAHAAGEGAAAPPSLFGQLLGALTGAAGPTGPPLPPGAPNPADPNYHAQLAELLFAPQSEFHEAAVLALLEVRPAAVTDKAVRERIAKGYKFVAFESGGHLAEAVRGLALWGGKFSVPLLVQLLDPQASAAGGEGAVGEDRALGGGGGDSGREIGRGDSGLGREGVGEFGGAAFGQSQPAMYGAALTPEAETAIYAALGELATPEAADAVVARLETAATTHGEAIAASLRTMGAVAEDALIKVLPFENSTEGNMTAILVLGDVGTRKSLSLLRMASRSENEQMAEAALESARKIQERLRTAREQEAAAAKPG